MAEELQSENYLAEVRNQYEHLPYPYRDPAQEKDRLVKTVGDALPFLNHYAFGGRQQYDDFRVLVAGGGTGDATLFLAEQLKAFPKAKVVHLDMSTASIAVAKERAEMRGLSNIEFRHASLLDVTESDEEYDLINCSGVLHHLADPDAGLRALKSVLKPEGVINLMVYGYYGRQMIYRMQEILRDLNYDGADIHTQIERAKMAFEAIKPTSWGPLAYQLMQIETQHHGDHGLFDMFLHSQDRAYTMPQLYEFVENADLQIINWNNGNLPYSVWTQADWIANPELRAHIAGMPERQRQAVTEKMLGNMMKHMCLIAHRTPETPSPEDAEMVPEFAYYMQGHIQKYANALTPLEDGKQVKTQIASLEFNWIITPFTRVLTQHILTSPSIGDLLETCYTLLWDEGVPGLTRSLMQQKWLEYYAQWHQHQLLYLRHPSSPAITIR